MTNDEAAAYYNETMPLPSKTRVIHDDKNLSVWLDIEIALRGLGVLVVPDNDDVLLDMREAAVGILDRRYGRTWPRAVGE